jgi:hypothetical protein
MAHLLPSPKMQFFDLNGDPLSGGKVNAYEAGTSTRKATYTTAAETVANANPVILDSRGEANIFWSTGVYKIVVTDSDDAEIYTVDNITLSATGSAGASFRAGSGVPSDSLGANGDRYLRVDSGQIYLKDASVYTVESILSLPASTIVNTPSGNLAAVTVQNALNELQTELDSATAHISDAIDAHAGTAITNTPSGNLAATTVQAALNELQTELDSATAHISDSSAAHAASAIANTPSGNLAATDVQAALNELQSDIDGREPTITTLALNKGGTGQTTKAPAFDALSPMSASGDMIYGGVSGTGTRLAKGSDGQILKLASGVPTWAAEAASGAFTVRSVATTDDTETTDDVIVLSGASFTLTLHTAVGNDGQVLEIVHGGTSLTQVYTLATTSSQTIGGIAGGSYALYTNQEVLKLVSDGADWIIVNHFAQTDFTSVSTINMRATTTAPTKGTATIIRDKILWRRVGAAAHVRMHYHHTTQGTASTGSGDYILDLPTGLVIDTAKVDVYTTAEGSGVWLGNGSLLGSFVGSNTSSVIHGMVVPYDSDGVRMFGGFAASGSQGPTAIGSGAGGLGQANVSMGLDFMVPISGWQP